MRRARGKAARKADEEAEEAGEGAIVPCEGPPAKRLKHPNAVPTQIVLAAAFSVGRVTAIAKEHNLSRKYVREATLATAWTWLERQRVVLDEALAVARERGVETFLDTRRFDSTKQ
eukprot:8930255-Lingulodinium_polyedra.AAC.1